MNLSRRLAIERTIIDMGLYATVRETLLHGDYGSSRRDGGQAGEV